MTDLSGRHIVVTRPDPQGSELCRLIEQVGGGSIFFPTIAFAPPPDSAVLQQALSLLGEQDWLVFISPQAVYAGVPLIRRTWPDFPANVQFAAVGAGTKNALHEAGYEVAHYPEEGGSEGVLALPAFQDLSGKKVAIIRGVGGRELLDDVFAERGARVLPVIVYQRVLPQAHNTEWLAERKIDAIVCTSFEGVQNLKDMLGETVWPLIKTLPLLVVSDRIKSLAQDLGFQTIWVSSAASNEAILERLMQVLTSD